MATGIAAKLRLRRDVMIAVAGIVAAFVATYLGVYLATAAQRQVDNDKAVAAFKALLRILHTDCKESLKVNRELSPASELPQLRNAACMYSAMLQRERQRFIDKRTADAKEFHKTYVSETERLCALFARAQA
jgi:hypothetical protein